MLSFQIKAAREGEELNVSKVTYEVSRAFGFQSAKQQNSSQYHAIWFKNSYDPLALTAFLTAGVNRDGFKHILSISLNSG